MTRLRVYSLILLLAGVLCGAARAQAGDSAVLRRIYDYMLTQSKCYPNLEHLCRKVGGRLSGSPQAGKAVEWARNAMYAAGADTVFLQPCMVPRWERGQSEKCELLAGKERRPLRGTALGSSVGTGGKGITAQVVEVSSFADLEKLGTGNIKGKIVFFNVYFDQTKVRPGHAYGEAVKHRARGASYAARYGAVAMVIRSMTSGFDDEPHTGNMVYDTAISPLRIPAIALGYQSADLLHQAIASNSTPRLYIETHCRQLPDVLSYNVVGQINGKRSPKEFIVAGGHLDSWDNGEGAHDDGAGVVQCIETIAAFRALGLVPGHSIRAIAFMNEENGLAGGTAYAQWATKNNEKHLAALETDAGGYSPRGFGIDTTSGLYQRVAEWRQLFHPYMIDRIEPGGGGADLSALEKTGVPCIGFEPDTQRYFDIHHTAQDTFDKINKRELELGAAAITSLLYLLDTHL